MAEEASRPYQWAASSLFQPSLGQALEKTVGEPSVELDIGLGTELQCQVRTASDTVVSPWRARLQAASWLLDSFGTNITSSLRNQL